MSAGETYKIVICGDFAVGKTTFVRTFLDEDKAFLAEYKPTIGVDIGRKIFTLQSIELCFQIWDLSGQATFKTVRPQFYNRTDGVILVFDITRRESFTNLSSWLEEILDQTGRIPIVLVGNKLDLVKTAEETVPQQEVEKFAIQISSITKITTPYIQASAIKRQNNLDPFISLGKLLIERQ
ncbi:MAG: Rab family GTPase [Candidatus Hodarchaeales archaeon]|jgi:small GTP-binding protein